MHQGLARPPPARAAAALAPTCRRRCPAAPALGCRALKAALTAAAELRGIGVRHPTVYLVSLYNMQRYLLSRELQRSSEGAALRAAASCQVGVPGLEVGRGDGEAPMRSGLPALCICRHAAPHQLANMPAHVPARCRHPAGAVCGCVPGRRGRRSHRVDCARPGPPQQVRRGSRRGRMAGGRAGLYLAQPLSPTPTHPFTARPSTLCCRSFFRDRRRINVALSRARHLSIVCGYRDVLALPKAQPWGRVLAGYSGMAPA